MPPESLTAGKAAGPGGIRIRDLRGTPSPWGEYAGASADPVFVLSTSRSGSTLLRFLLDAHPDLGCPPEFKLPAMCAQLMSAWSAIAKTGQFSGGDGPRSATAVAAAGVRHTMDLMVGPYLAERGKKRYCNKDLGTEQHVETLLQVYPETRFICLYRHPMDMIASGIEACPWGLNQYGFEPYVAASPGNTVLALARYWADHTSAIIAVEERYPDMCHRVRYEDLVADPDTVTGEIFEFLGIAPVDDIATACFSLERERSGPGDYKIWTTSGVNADSLGRGWAIPANLIPEPMTATLNDLAAKLSYVPISSGWGTAGRPADLRIPAEGDASAASPGRPVTGALLSGARLLGERLQLGLPRIDSGFSRRWAEHATESFLVIAMAPGGQEGDVWWRVELNKRRIVAGAGPCEEDADWTVSAPAEAWEQLIRLGTNLGVAFRRLGMRYVDNREGSGTLLADTRVAMMSELLGMQTWQSLARNR